jgi:adenylate cyclase
MTTQELIRVIIAVGSPAPRPETQLRTDEVVLIRLLVDVGRKSGGDEALLRVARVFGEATRKAADSAVAIFDENINSPVVRARIDDDRRMAVNRLAAELMANSELLIARLYRRHLEHTLMRFWAVSAERFLDDLGVRPARSEPPGLAFVDLTGYTRLTESGGDEMAAQLAIRLADLSETAASRHEGRVVKLLGDGAMLHFGRGLDAVRGALALVDLIEASDLPPAHAGVHSGPVIERDGDYFGATVNLAARISAQAGAGQVVTSAAVAGSAAADLRFEPLGAREMKGVGALELFLARRT